MIIDRLCMGLCITVRCMFLYYIYFITRTTVPQAPHPWRRVRGSAAWPKTVVCPSLIVRQIWHWHKSKNNCLLLAYTEKSDERGSRMGKIAWTSSGMMSAMLLSSESGVLELTMLTNADDRTRKSEWQNRKIKMFGHSCISLKSRYTPSWPIPVAIGTGHYMTLLARVKLEYW